jgi:hypothetical protein
MLRTAFILASLTFISLGAYAQESEEEEAEEREAARAGTGGSMSGWAEVPEWVRLMNSEHPDVLKVMGAYEAYYRTHPFEKNIDTKRYKRFVHDAVHDPQPRDPEGREEYRHDLQHYVNASHDLLAERSVNWTCIGPFDYDNTAASKSYAQGAAHVYTVEQSTVDPNLIWAGTATAGVWKSIDKGLSWTNSTKEQMEKFCQAVEPDPYNTGWAYAGLGSDLMKTTDGGGTWTEVGGGVFSAGTRNIYEIVVHPTQNNKVLLACSDGLWKSTDWGANFQQAQIGEWQEIELKPNSPDTIYAVKKTYWGLAQSAHLGFDLYYAAHGDRRDTSSAELGVCPGHRQRQRRQRAVRDLQKREQGS